MNSSTKDLTNFPKTVYAVRKDDAARRGKKHAVTAYEVGCVRPKGIRGLEMYLVKYGWLYCDQRAWRQKTGKFHAADERVEIFSDGKEALAFLDKVLHMNKESVEPATPLEKAFGNFVNELKKSIQKL